MSNNSKPVQFIKKYFKMIQKHKQPIKLWWNFSKIMQKKIKLILNQNHINDFHTKTRIFRCKFSTNWQNQCHVTLRLPRRCRCSPGSASQFLKIVQNPLSFRFPGLSWNSQKNRIFFLKIINTWRYAPLFLRTLVALIAFDHVIAHIRRAYCYICMFFRDGLYFHVTADISLPFWRINFCFRRKKEKGWRRRTAREKQPRN